MEDVMALSIRDPETDRLARELAALTGETMTAAIRTALRERLDRESDSRAARMARKRCEAMAILERIWQLPVLDDRSADEILGYDEHGLPS
jgi:antitoxin VapB